ncbi:MAG: hypothetical protein ACI9ND_003174, partial [Yoonia sp.]
ALFWISGDADQSVGQGFDAVAHALFAPASWRC